MASLMPLPFAVNFFGFAGILFLPGFNAKPKKSNKETMADFAGAK